MRRFDPNARLVGVTVERWRLVAVLVLVLGMAVVLTRDFAPVEAQPAPDAQSYAQLADNLAGGDGYQVSIPGEPEGSRYPPGLPMMLTPLVKAGVPAERAAQALTVGLLVAVWMLAGQIAGSVASAVSVLVLVTSGALMAQSAFVMADVAGALVTVVAGWCVVTGRHRLGGVLAGWAAWTRLAAVVTVLAMRRRAWLPFALVVAGLVVARQVTGFGYEGGQAEWRPSFLWSDDGMISPEPRGGNLWAYLTMLLGVGGSLTFPGVLALAAWGAWTHPGGRWALTVCAGTLAVYLPYFYQAERFMFPVLALGAVYAGAAVDGIVTRQSLPLLDLRPVLRRHSLVTPGRQ